MSLPLLTFLTGIAAVFIVMSLLLGVVKLSSALAIYLDKKKDAASPSKGQ